MQSLIEFLKRPACRRASLLLAAISLWALPATAEFQPPRIQYVINPVQTGRSVEQDLSKRRYYIDRGLLTSINKGDILNVYREKRPVPGMQRPMRMFIGTMEITDAQPQSSVGVFHPADAIAHPIIRHKVAMKGDIVVPRLVIDNSVLFDPGQATLKANAGQEFDKVATFVQNFSPSKLIIEGHTDSDGDEETNLLLSDQRAGAVRDYLIQTYNFITPAMIEAQGYGETQPIAPNDTPENKQLNRRIEVLVWE